VLVEVQLLVCLDQILLLTNLCLERSLVEELNKVDIVFLLSEMLLEEVVDGRFNHESIVDGDVSDFWLDHQNGFEQRGRMKTYYTVPTWLASPGNRVVADIVPDQETGLKLFAQLDSQDHRR
jgi:hypothetical protein